MNALHEAPPGAATAARVHLPRGHRLREFVIERVLGDGGFGVVYAALDLRLERRVAIKEYLPAALASRAADYSVHMGADPGQRHAFEVGLKSFVNEAKLLARFEHPALIKVHQFWQEKGTAYMVMPYYAAPTLRAWRRAQASPVDELWLREFLLAAMDGLQALHDARCLHRDVAPDNILVLNGRAPLLLDFGAARRVLGPLTQTLTVMVKPSYAPLEQYAEAPALRQGPWTDVYALGAVAHFMLTGEPPPPAVSRAVCETAQPLVQRLRGRYSYSLLSAIDAALAVRPQERPPTVAVLRALMDARAREWAPTELLPRPPAAAPPQDAGATPTVGAQTAAGRRRRAQPALAFGAIGAIALALVIAATRPPAVPTTVTASTPAVTDVVLAPVARALQPAERPAGGEAFTLTPARIEPPAGTTAPRPRQTGREGRRAAPGAMPLPMPAPTAVAAATPMPAEEIVKPPLARAPDIELAVAVQPVVAAAESAPATAPMARAELRVLRRAEPVFPPEALREGVRGGRVLAQVAINADGSVGAVDIVEAEPRRVFERAVRRALAHWRYEPPGEPRSARVEFVFRSDG
ncbi:MAG: TonB family protein [Burkholderiaceae bacterium]|nr:TonB family protein [Burkholderiaceae bacterium]